VASAEGHSRTHRHEWTKHVVLIYHNTCIQLKQKNNTKRENKGPGRIPPIATVAVMVSSTGVVKFTVGPQLGSPGWPSSFFFVNVMISIKMELHLPRLSGPLADNVSIPYGGSMSNID
jgi:hypothetical protein